MAALIDSGILIDCERGKLDLASAVRGREEEEFYVSVITASELLHGVWRATDPRVRSRRSAFVESVLQQLPLVQIDLPVARAHAQLWADLQAKGLMIGTHDSWLAATCIAHGLTIVTGNEREFARVPGLAVEVWT